MFKSPRYIYWLISLSFQEVSNKNYTQQSSPDLLVDFLMFLCDMYVYNKEYTQQFYVELLINLFA